ncbi:MAG: T9SS type A sorting domain-containing protein [Opitutaceae bacterium]|nr:T9SS type A sorting domain-containing protein [Cytophagales bacterium]
MKNNSYLKTISVAFILITSLSNILFSQPLGNKPDFLDGVRQNFYKMQRKADRHFKKHPISQLREEADTSTQEIDFEKEYDREEDNEYHRYKRWEWYWRDRINPDGSFPDAQKVYEAYMQQQASGNFRLESVNPIWFDISMNKNSGGYWGMGRTQSVAVNPKNSLEFYTTSNGGGVWKTIDGGKTYKPVGDQLPMLFCGKVIMDHTNTNTVYVSTGEDHSNAGGLGVFKSTDGGVTWNATGLTATRTNTIAVKTIAMNPVNSSIMLAATNKGLYRTINGGGFWTVVRTGNYSDLAYKPLDGNTVYASTNADMFRSLDGGVTWNQVTTLNNNTETRISTSLSDPAYVAFALIKTGATGQMYVSRNSGASFDLFSNIGDGCEFHVSNANIKNVYCGCVDNFRSTDGGLTWAKFTYWSGGNALPEVHADNHGINFDPSKPYEIYISNDGGVDKYNEQTNTWTRLSNGLAITMYYQIAVAQTDPVVVAGGTQDNGGNMRKRAGTWINTTGGDATMCLIDPSNDQITYSQYINGDGITRTNNAWTSRTTLDNNILAAGVVAGDGDWATPFAIHEVNPSIIVAGYKDVILSTNRGDTWKKISTGLETANLKKIAISATSADHIYAANGSSFYRTFDQGATAWSKTIHPGGGVSYIIVHPTEPKTVYTTNNGGNGKRVYKSTDGGINWINLSAGLPNDVAVTCIAYEKNSNEALYVGTPIGVFYKNATMTSWIYFGTGLPNTSITDLQISYSAKKLRAGTFGRGIWEAELYSSIITGNENTPLNTNKLDLYPNPFQDELVVSQHLTIIKLRIFSLAGVLIAEPILGENGLIKTNGLPKGQYFLEIISKDGSTVTKKIVKE